MALYRPVRIHERDSDPAGQITPNDLRNVVAVDVTRAHDAPGEIEGANGWHGLRPAPVHRPNLDFARDPVSPEQVVPTVCFEVRNPLELPVRVRGWTVVDAAIVGLESRAKTVHRDPDEIRRAVAAHEFS